MKRSKKPVIGWREWVQLPAFSIKHIKAKIDTGARTSALHAQEIQYVQRAGTKRVRFTVYPKQRNTHYKIAAEADWVAHRTVRSSSGHEEERPVVLTMLQIGDQSWPIEITLTSRDVMGFRMLLGREAIRKRLVVDAGRSFMGGNRPPKRK